MKHVSMLPPREPAYRLVLEQRKLKWAEQKRRAAQLEMECEAYYRRVMSRAQPRWPDGFKSSGGQGAAGLTAWWRQG